MNTDTISDFTIAVDYDSSLEDMIRAGKYCWEDPDINQERFPVEGRGIMEFRAKLFNLQLRPQYLV